MSTGNSTYHQEIRMGEWYLAKRQTNVSNYLIERVVMCGASEDLLEIYAIESLEKGLQQKTELVDMVHKKYKSLLKPKVWLKRTLVNEVWHKTGDWFAIRIQPVLAVTSVFNEKTEMWERIELYDGKDTV